MMSILTASGALLFPLPNQSHGIVAFRGPDEGIEDRMQLHPKKLGISRFHSGLIARARMLSLNGRPLRIPHDTLCQEIVGTFGRPP
jgi:hypothetical protein